MNKIFALGAVVFLFGAAVIGCSNTAEGAKQDAATDTSAVKDAGDRAAVATEKATDHAVAATEQAAGNAAVATKEAADKAAVATEKAGKNTSDALTLTPKVKLAIINDSELNNVKNLVNVNSGNNQVRLDGHVLTNEMKKRAGMIAQKTVKEANSPDMVENNLKVTGQ